MNAVSLNSVTINVARIVGAAFGGLVATVLGLALCFGLNGLSFFVVVAMLLMMRGNEISQHRRETPRKGQIREGFAYVVRTPEPR